MLSQEGDRYNDVRLIAVEKHIKNYRDPQVAIKWDDNLLKIYNMQNPVRVRYAVSGSIE